MLDPLWSRPAAPRDVERALTGRRIEALRRRGKYLIADLDGDRHLVMHLRMTGNLLWVPPGDDREPRPHLSVRLTLDDGHRLLFVDQRRFGTGRRDRGDRTARRIPRPAGRPGAARPGVHARRPRPRRPRPPCPGEGLPARPAPRGRRREHLRRRGPVSRGHPSAAPGGPPAPRRDRAPARGHRGDPRARDRPAGRLDRRLPGLQRRARLDAGRVPDPSARGSAVHPLRPPGDEDGRRRAGDIRVPPLPAAPRVRAGGRRAR